MVLPHILNGNTHARLAGVRCKRTVKLHVHVEQLLLVPVVTPPLQGMHHHLPDAHTSRKGEHARHLRHQHLRIVRISAAEGRVRLIEYHAATICQRLDAVGGLAPVLPEQVFVVVSQIQVDCRKPGVHHQLKSALQPVHIDHAGCCG